MRASHDRQQGSFVFYYLQVRCLFDEECNDRCVSSSGQSLRKGGTWASALVSYKKAKAFSVFGNLVDRCALELKLFEILLTGEAEKTTDSSSSSEGRRRIEIQKTMKRLFYLRLAHLAFIRSGVIRARTYLQAHGMHSQPL